MDKEEGWDTTEDQEDSVETVDPEEFEGARQTLELPTPDEPLKGAAELESNPEESQEPVMGRRGQLWCNLDPSNIVKTGRRSTLPKPSPKPVAKPAAVVHKKNGKKTTRGRPPLDKKRKEELAELFKINRERLEAEQQERGQQLRLTWHAGTEEERQFMTELETLRLRKQTEVEKDDHADVERETEVNPGVLPKQVQMCGMQALIEESNSSQIRRRPSSSQLNRGRVVAGIYVR